MHMKQNIQQKVEDTLNSLDGIQGAEPTPFFYTRLRTRMQSGERSVWVRMGSFIGKPAVVIAGLCMVLIFNAVLLIRQEITPTRSMPVVSSTDLVTDNEYVLATNSSFDYENLDQQ